ncbi:MAG: MFS transporter [Bauldia sp.]
MAETPGYRTLLALKSPRRLALGAVPAELADWLDYAAIVSLLVFVWDEGPFVLAIFAVMLVLPYILVGPVIIALVHRLSLRTVLVGSNAGRALVTVGLIFAGDTTALLALVFLRSAVDSVFTPARHSAIQATTPKELLPLANGIHQAITQVSKIAGPASGGLLLGVMAPASVFAINAGLSVLAAAIMLFVAMPPHPAEEAAETFRQRTLAGLDEIRRNRKVRLAVAFVAMAYAAFFFYDALVGLLTEEFGFDSTAFGLSIAASGLGGVAGALAGGRLAGRRPFVLMGAGAGIGSVFTIAVGVAGVIGFAIPLWLFFVAMAFMGGAAALMMVPYRFVVQSTVPPERIARVFAAGDAISVAVMLAAPFAGSAVAGAWGTGSAFVAGGVVLLLLFAWTFLGPARRA